MQIKDNERLLNTIRMVTTPGNQNEDNTKYQQGYGVGIPMHYWNYALWEECK